MYEKLLKEELKEGNWVLVKSYTTYEIDGKKSNFPKFEINSVQGIEDDHILVSNIFSDDSVAVVKEFSHVSPVVLTDQHLKDIGLKDDENVEVDYNPEWKLYDFHGIKLAFNGVSLYNYDKEYDKLYGLKVKTIGNSFKYIHQVQNLIIN